MRCIIAIDVGVRNLGFCVYDLDTQAVVDWRNVALCETVLYTPGDNVSLVMHFVQRNKHWFENCAKLIIEKQIRCNMRIIEAVFHTLFYDRCIVVHAKNVKLHFGTSTGNYKDNKRRAVDYVTANLPTLAASESCAETWRESSKKDDLADALLLVHYFLRTHVFE